MVPVTALLLKVTRIAPPPPHVYRMLEERQIVGVRGWGAGVLATPPAVSSSEGGRRGSHWLWAPPSVWVHSCGLAPENWSNLFGPVYASAGFFAGVGVGGVYLSGHLQQQFSSISEMSANKRE